LCYFFASFIEVQYCDRLWRDVDGWLVVTRAHCGQTVLRRPVVTIEH